MSSNQIMRLRRPDIKQPNPVATHPDASTVGSMMFNQAPPESVVTADPGHGGFPSASVDAVLTFLVEPPGPARISTAPEPLSARLLTTTYRSSCGVGLMVAPLDCSAQRGTGWICDGRASTRHPRTQRISLR